MHKLGCAVPLGVALTALTAWAAPLDDVNQYADRCAAELGAGAGAYLPIDILPMPEDFSDSQEVPVFWNQKRITFQETDPGSGIPHAGTDHWEFLFDGQPGAIGFPDAANIVGRIEEGNRQDLKCDFWSHVQTAVRACVGGTKDANACAAAGDCPGGACRIVPTGCFPGQRALQRDVGTCRNPGAATDSMACRDDNQCGGGAGSCRDIVTWSMVFRRLLPPKSGQATFNPSHPFYYNNFDVVAFKADTGGTCWFDTLEIGGLTKDGWWNAPGTPSGLSRAGGRDLLKKARAITFWETPAQVMYTGDPGQGDKRCTGCHGNGPILISRWINQGGSSPFTRRQRREIPYWHPAKLLPNPFFKTIQCGDSCHNSWSLSANTMPDGTLATAMTSNPPAGISSNYRLQLDDMNMPFAKTCRGNSPKEGQPCNVDADCGGGTCRVGQNAGILRDMPHRFTGTPAQWDTDVKPSYDAMTPCLRVCAGGARAGSVCAENGECPGSTCPAVPDAACSDTAQAMIPKFFGAQSIGPFPAGSQLIRPPFPAVNVSFERANCVVAMDGSETCDSKAQWQDPTAGESDYHAADKYYLVSNSVANQPGQAPSTARFCTTTNVEVTSIKMPLAASNWAMSYRASDMLAACTVTEFRLCGGYAIDSAEGANDAHSPVDSRNDGDAQSGTLITACANALQAARSGFRLNRSTGRYVQTVTLKNNGTATIVGPISYLLFSLSANATLFGASKTTTILPIGTSYVNVDIGPGNVLGPGETATITLQFTNPTNQGITYDSRIRTGMGNL